MSTAAAPTAVARATVDRILKAITRVLTLIAPPLAVYVPAPQDGEDTVCDQLRMSQELHY